MPFLLPKEQAKQRDADDPKGIARGREDMDNLSAVRLKPSIRNSMVPEKRDAPKTSIRGR